MTPDETDRELAAPAENLPALPPKVPRFSGLLRQIAEAHEDERMTVGDLLRAMEGRASAALLFIFAFPNILPSPPGLAAVLGLPLIYLSTQMMMGRDPWLPQFIAGRSMSREAFRNVVLRAAPVLDRAERLLRQRWWPLVTPAMVRVMGFVCLLLALLLSLPVPLGNLMPATAICVIALALLERDGVWITLGLGMTVAAFGWVGGIGYGLIKSAIYVVINAF
ncbi:Uncharacterized conserved protein [Gemmobacter aquatilis]|uniref:Uncharacterized conserved protein n=1 Tax=Gemmobacter aquatilis TaxID=933059 RepID=A0A1H7ZPY6_9RHOB|nr:exopolysaccharide biosynthesis protein [Gemmobacter aquatilis]SEM59477.1 Uncharacterized conserved protein [Gemmobacter aquatilis]